MRFSTVSRSASSSSVLTRTASRAGSTFPSTWAMRGSSKSRRMCRRASTWRIWLMKWLPNPSPFPAPRIRAMKSTNSSVAGVTFLGLKIREASRVRRGSGTLTAAMAGSVPPCWLTGAPPATQRRLKSVVFPVAGRPMIPMRIWKAPRAGARLCRRIVPVSSRQCQAGSWEMHGDRRKLLLPAFIPDIAFEPQRTPVPTASPLVRRETLGISGPRKGNKESRSEKF